MESTATTSSRRNPCFMGGDFNNRDPVVAEFELGYSVNSLGHNYSVNLSALSRDFPMRVRNLSASQRSVRGRFPGGGFEEQRPPHFLDACFLCKQPLSSKKDIFMYRGDTPFCSVECRQEQIEMDEAREKSLNLRVSVRALRKKEQRQSSSPPPDCPFRGTLAAA